MKKSFTIALLSILTIVLGAGSCKSKKNKDMASKQELHPINDTITTESGLQYIYRRHNPEGQVPDSGDQVEVHYVGTLTDGKKFDSSKDRNKTFKFQLGAGRVIKGWDEGFKYLKKGDSATLIIPPHLGYGSRNMGTIPPNSTLIFEVELVDIAKPMKYEPFSGAGKDTVKLPSGLQYIVIEKGDVTKPASQATEADIYYAGYLEDGTKFDGNFGTVEPFSLPVKGAPVIEGWKEMLPLMNQGMKVRVIIPSKLGYGASGYPGVIPPNATLIFDMYIDDLR